MLFVGATISNLGWNSAGAQDAKKDEKPQIPGGIEAHIKKVDMRRRR